MHTEKKQPPVVSIIMPAYNTADYIARGIESCKKQSYPEWELIVIDDASGDNTVEVVQNVAEGDLRIRIIEAEHGGVSKARNRGIEEARGEYLLFLDSDDWLETNVLEELLKLQEFHREKLVACDRYSVLCSEDGTILSKTRRPKKAALLSRKESLLMTGREQYNNSSGAYKLFHRDIIEKYHIRFNTSVSYGEDELFVFQYLLHSDGMLFTEQAYWNIMERSGSATRAGFKRAFLTSLDAVDKMKESALQDNPADAEILTRLSELKMEKARILLRRYLDGNENDPESLQSLRRVIRSEIPYYTRHCGLVEKMKIYAAAYCPWKWYSFAYNRKGNK